MNKRCIIFLLLIITLLLSGCTTNPEPETRNREQVTNIEFKDRSGVIIDTEQIVIAAHNDEVEFIETTTDEFVVYETKTEDFMLFEGLWYYTVEIPTEHLKEVSRKYADAFDETLPIERTQAEDK